LGAAVLDLLDAVALSLLPRVIPPRLAAAVRDAIARDARLRGPEPARVLEAVVPELHPDDAPRIRRATIAAARERAADALARGRVAGLQPIAWTHEAYPQLLVEIPDPPPVLWVRGNLEALRAPSVAIVGSRAGSPYARDVATRLAFDLARCGIVVTSGLARGVDGAAHQGALDAGGITIGVCGTGADVVYPAEHRGLATAMLDRGAIVSELPPGTAPRPHHFPLRNRILSGLSLAVVVVEASAKSGSLITARCALEQGREVMAVPGNVLNGRNRGSHALLKDGAKVVEEAVDILEELPSGLGTAPPRAPADPVLDVMQAGETYDLDTLVTATRLDGSTLLSLLLELELAGRIARVDGGWLARSC
jgi:DNA processing protein